MIKNFILHSGLISFMLLITHFSYAQMDLTMAVQGGDTFDIQKVLDRDVDINTKFDKGNTALFYACLKGKPIVIRFLLSKGAKPNVQNDDGTTPLMVAARITMPMQLCSCLIMEQARE